MGPNNLMLLNEDVAVGVVGFNPLNIGPQFTKYLLSASSPGSDKNTEQYRKKGVKKQIGTKL